MEKISFSAKLLKIVLKFSLKNKYKSIKELRSQSIGNENQLSRFIPGIKIKKITIGNINTSILIDNLDNRKKTILFLHGGGFVTGGSSTHLLLCMTLVKSIGQSVILPEYRLAPEYPYPAALEDALEVYNWIIADGYKSQDITIMGDSAGGGLALSLVQLIRDTDKNMPGAVVCISPWTDLTLSGQSVTDNSSKEIVLRIDELSDWTKMYTANANKKDPLISPLFANYERFPKLLIQAGSDEILLDDARRIYKNAQFNGIDAFFRIWPGMWHDWHLFGIFLPEALAAIAEIKDFLAENTDYSKISD